MQPPIAEHTSVTLTQHGITRIDPYAWMRDPNWPEVKDPQILAHLEAENAYTALVLKPTEKLQAQLYQEMRGRIQEEDISVPVEEHGYGYYTRQVAGGDYHLTCRKALTPGAEEEILLDHNQLAKGKEYWAIGGEEIDPTHHLLAYGIDETGEERYQLVLKDLAKNCLLPDTLNDTTGHAAWHPDGHGFYYTKYNAMWRADRVYFHRLCTTQAEDELIYEEADTTFRVDVHTSNSKRLVFLVMSSSTASEWRMLDTKVQEADWQIIAPRRDDHLYCISHSGEFLWILTNDKGRNFRLVRTKLTAPEESNWEEVIAVSDHCYLMECQAYMQHLTLTIREAGITQIQVLQYATETWQTIDFPECNYDVNVLGLAYESLVVRLSYSSLVTPPTVYDYHMDTETLEVRKVRAIPSGYDASLYACERIFAPSREENIQIPITLVYRKDQRKGHGNPLYLYGYGSYGYATSARFRSNILSLLDRGFVFAIAHIRGGDEMGFDWYESAKFHTKQRTFDDFIDCARGLIAKGWTQAGQIVCAGGSAGGLLIGAVINQAPELFGAAIAHVPFVDVLNTMLDATLPLTPGEYKEWGNPEDPAFYHTIASYSPYDQVKAQAYPPVFAFAGLSDPRVGYWEAAKWVAALREHATNQPQILLKINMGFGHFGASGRFEYLKEIAMEYAYIIRLFEL
jgi:oligopeptidase B